MSSIKGESYTCWTSSRVHPLPGVAASTADASERICNAFAGAVRGRGEWAGPPRERTAPRSVVKSVRGAADISVAGTFGVEESNKELRVGEDGGTPAKDDKKFLRLSICILL